MSDPLGSIAVVTDSTGAVTGRRLYKPWGENRGPAGSLPTPFGYTGQREEAALGLSFYNARWYDPALGRWLQPDSIVPDKFQPLAFDRYAYVANNPIKFNDPSGHCWGIASGMQDWTFLNYGITCNNLDMALTIIQSEETTVGQKVRAAGYVATVGGAHLGLAAGGALLACSAIAPCVKAAEGALGIGTAACADGDCGNEANAASQTIQGAAQTAQSVIDKLQRYLLNPEHTAGGPKAKWFEQALGYTRENMAQLAEQIVFDPNKARPTELTQFGQKFEQIISITGANGKVIDVPFIWIKNLDGVIRLVTVPWIPKK